MNAPSLKDTKEPRIPLRATDPVPSDNVGGTGVVSKALGILEYVGLRGDASFAELLKTTALPRSTLHRLLKELVDHRFLQRSSQGNYRCTMKLWRIGARCAHYDTVDQTIHPVLHALSEECDETAHYAIYEDGFTVFVAKVDARDSVPVRPQIGGRGPAHASATGKAILAWRDDEEITRVARAGKRFNPSTIVEPDALLRHLKEVRDQGYAVSPGDWQADKWAVAAPIVQSNGHVESAIGIVGPAERVRSHLELHIDAVVRAARGLSTVAAAVRKPRAHHRS